MLEIMVFLLEMIKAFFLTQDNEETKEKRNGKSLSQSWEIAHSKDSMSKVCFSKLFIPNCF